MMFIFALCRRVVKMMTIVDKIYNWLWRGSLYVIADARDNSITFSRRLFHHVKRHARTDKARIMTFLVKGDTILYAFMSDPAVERETEMAKIQVNYKFNTIGFECLVPTVNRIFYDYGIPAGVAVKLTVTPHRTPAKNYYYVIEKPITTPLCQK